MKTVDCLYQCDVPGQNFGIWPLRCHLCIFDQYPDAQIVVATDMGCETNWFIPYKLEQLVTQVVHEFHLNPDRLIWIEHDPCYGNSANSVEFSQVLFQWDEGKAVNPEWHALDDDLEEALIRGTLDRYQLGDRPLEQRLRSSQLDRQIQFIY